MEVYKITFVNPMFGQEDETFVESFSEERAKQILMKEFPGAEILSIEEQFD
ncbi:hypothetical protein D3C85_1846330 [compost metagenome]